MQIISWSSKANNKNIRKPILEQLPFSKESSSGINLNGTYALGVSNFNYLVDTTGSYIGGDSAIELGTRVGCITQW